RKDERGFLFRDQSDVATGAQVQEIRDVNTALTTDQPAGWTTPPGGGLHLVTETTIDWPTMEQIRRALEESNLVEAQNVLYALPRPGS
ncbi:MAG: hypothetical protein ACRD9W_21800, partial [Terriglobia bacterium]